jgi:hypothetical protein
MRLADGFAALGAVACLLLPAAATPAEMRGVTATEIRIGQTMPYSGPVSAFGGLGKGEVGYFKMVNERGGINGRKVNLISLDDGYAPPKTVEQTRRLVESDEVALIFSSIGTAHNKYLVGVLHRLRGHRRDAGAVACATLCRTARHAQPMAAQPSLRQAA